MSDFEKWKHDLIAREPLDTPKPPKLMVKAKKRDYGISQILDRVEGPYGECTECGEILAHKTLQEKAKHYAQESVKAKYRSIPPPSAPDSIGE